MPATLACPLLAAGIDWLEALLPLLFFAFWVISQVVNVIRKVGGAAAPRPIPPRPAAAEPGAESRGDLERQIEEFLERSRGAPRQPPREQPATKRRPRGPQPPRQRQQQEAAQASPQPARGDGRLGSLGARGTDVARHVRDAFAHEIGHLAAPLAAAGGSEAAAVGAADRSPAAAALVAALRSPASVRQAMLLREVLDRPVDRWE